MLTRQNLSKTKRWVVKIGSALLTEKGSGLNHKCIADWVRQISHLAKSGKEILIVSSGSIAEGIHRMGWSERPKALNELQAAAAVGQMGLVQAYESCFQKEGLHTAQILLTHDDLSDRKRYLNARSTLQALLDLKVVPIINENDTVITDEIRFGDNDTLAALVANLVDAEGLMILTNQQGLFERDPTLDPDAKLVREGQAGDLNLEAMSSNRASALGRGGMRTKLRAATIAARSGAVTLIASGYEKNIITSLIAGEDKGTLLLPRLERMDARKQWLAGHLQVKGSLELDSGAVKAIQAFGRSLLPIGVVAVKGQFNRGEMVACVDDKGIEIARGLTNYASSEAQKILKKSSDAFTGILGYQGEPELIHRDNMILM